MPTTVTIGEGPNAKDVELGDEFLELSPDQQQATVNDIARQLNVGSGENVSKDDGNWRRGAIAPIEKKVSVDEQGKMTDTGEWRFAVPGMVMGILDAISLPGEVMRGEVDPMSEEGFERGMNLAMTGISPIKGGGMAAGRVAGKAAGEVMEETIENVGRGGKITGRLGNVIPESAARAEGRTDGTITQAVSRDIVDQELDAVLAKINAMEPKKVLGKPGQKFKHKLGDKPEVLKEGIEKTGKPHAISQFGVQYGGELNESLVSSPRGVIKIPATGELGTVPVELKIRQASRFKTAAQYAGENEFKQELARLSALNGRELTPNIERAMTGSKNAVAELTDQQVWQFTEKAAEVAKKTSPEKAGFWDKIFEVWMNSLLSGPSTLTINPLSSALVNVYGLAEHGLAASISKVTGSGISFKEVGHRIMADMEGIGDALRTAGVSFRTEKALFEADALLDMKHSMQAIGGPVGSFARLPGRTLTAQDTFFKSLAYRQEINGLAVRNALDEGLKGRSLASRIAELKSNPTEAMTKSAEEYAKRQTFTNGLGPIAKHGQAIVRGVPAARYIVPFYRTPVNLLNYSFSRLPTAALSKNFRNDLLGKNGSAARDMAIAKVTMGSAIGAYVMHEVAKGNVSGYGPLNQAERRTWLADGNQPYSIKVDGHWYSFSRLEPLGTILGVGADAQSIGDEMTDAELDQIASLIVGSITNGISNKTWLRGPVEFSQAVNEPNRYGESYVANMLGTVVPSAVAQYARSQDPYLREAKGLLDTFKMRLPGWRETLAVRHDPFGNPIKAEGGLGPDIMSPIYTRAAKNDPTIAELQRLEAFPGRITKDMENVELLPQEWSDYSEIAGRMTKQYSDAIINAPGYKEIPDNMKREMLEDGFRKARDLSKTTLKSKYPDLSLRIARQRAAKNLGLEEAPPMQGAPLPVP